MHLSKRITASLYQFCTFLPLYNSKIFTSDNYDDVFKTNPCHKRFNELLPNLIASQSGFFPKKFLYTKLQFNPQSERIKIVTLRARGFLTQEFHIDKIIPWSFRDMSAYSRLPKIILPPFVDDEMIYFNTMLSEHLFCQNDGVWNQSTVNHPKLSLATRINEKEWMDRHSII